MKIFIFSMLLNISCLFANTTMVFLVENADGKFVGISKNLPDYELHTEAKYWSLYPSISSDGQNISYVQGKDDKSLQLMVENLNTRELQTLSEPGFVLQPQFANSSNQLFYSMKMHELNSIFFLNLNNPNEISNLSDEYSAYFPAPFQNGERIVYQRNAPKKEIVIRDLKTNVSNIIGHGMAPSLSKDEKFIAYTSKVDGNWDIYVYNRFTKVTLRVTNDAARDFSPTFDLENNLIYTSDRIEENVFSIFKQDLNSWTQNKLDEKIILSKKGTSFYAPKISGLTHFKQNNLPKMIGEPRSSFGSIAINNSVYVVGGHQGAEHTYPPESFTGRVTKFDQIQKIWSDMAPRLNPSHGFQLIDSLDQKSLLAFGGFAYEETTTPKWKSLNIVEKFDIATNTWTQDSLMPRKRSSNVVARVFDKVYLIGGWDATPKQAGDYDGTFHDEIDVLDLKTNTWSTLASKLPLKRRAFSSFVYNNKIYLAGGISEGADHFKLLNLFTEFDPITETFKELPELPFETFAPASGIIGDQAFIFGGMFKIDTFDYEYIPHIYQFDFKTNKWQHSGRYLKEYKGFSQVVNLSERCLGVMGGHSYDNDEDRPVDSFETFCRQ